MRPAAPELLSPVPGPERPDLPVPSPFSLKYVLNYLAYLLAAVAILYWLLPPDQHYGIYVAVVVQLVVKLENYRQNWRLRRLAAAPESLPPQPLPARSSARHDYLFKLWSWLDLPLGLLLTGFCLWLMWGLIPPPKLSDVFFSLFFIPLALIGYWLMAVQQRSWLWLRYCYDAATDGFQRDRLYYFGPYQRRERWPAADFLGIYWQRHYGQDYASGPIAMTASLWLAGRAGGEDVLLGEFSYWYRDNHRLAQRLAVELSNASGLPVLYRWPDRPRDISAES